MPESTIFATLRGDARIWAIGAIHGEAERLAQLHAHIGASFAPGDQIVYLGNYFGRGPSVRATIDEMLLFRRALLACPGVDASDIVFLRGAQEEMCQKLLQVHLAADPVEVLRWMDAQGIGPTAAAYGASIADAIRAGRNGPLSLTKWTTQLRRNIHAVDGHTALLGALRHAAVTNNRSLLFVHAGIDVRQPLAAQGDRFWWGGAGFATPDAPFEGYSRIVRGYDRRHGGVAETRHRVTLDGGAGFGGDLIGACFDPSGSIATLLSA